MIADVIDTMHLMNLQEELKQCRNWVSKLDVKKAVDVSLFETTIRILGGFIAAYHLTEDTLYRDKAGELAEALLPAFKSKPFPYPTVNLKTGSGRSDRCAICVKILQNLDF